MHPCSLTPSTAWACPALGGLEAVRLPDGDTLLLSSRAYLPDLTDGGAPTSPKNPMSETSSFPKGSKYPTLLFSNLHGHLGKVPGKGW